MPAGFWTAWVLVLQPSPPCWRWVQHSEFVQQKDAQDYLTGVLDAQREEMAKTESTDLYRWYLDGLVLPIDELPFRETRRKRKG